MVTIVFGIINPFFISTQLFFGAKQSGFFINSRLCTYGVLQWEMLLLNMGYLYIKIAHNGHGNGCGKWEARFAGVNRSIPCGWGGDLP